MIFVTAVQKCYADKPIDGCPTKEDVTNYTEAINLFTLRYKNNLIDNHAIIIIITFIIIIHYSLLLLLFYNFGQNSLMHTLTVNKYSVAMVMIGQYQRAEVSESHY